MNEAFLGLTFTAAAFAQPHVAGVRSAADFGYGVDWGAIGAIFGTGLSDASRSASTIPYPLQLGPTKAYLCLPGIPSPQQNLDATCEALGLLYAGPTQVNFRMPLPPLRQHHIPNLRQRLQTA